MPARARQDYRMRMTPGRRARKRRACAKRPLDMLRDAWRCGSAVNRTRVLRQRSGEQMRLSVGRLATA